MNQSIEIPSEIKRWNWGAFLLCPFWCMRHGIWQGFLLVIPIFGLFVPLWMGAKGNQKAWRKNNQEPPEHFLRRQRFWSIAALVFWMSGLTIILGSLAYSLNYSDGMKIAIETANANKRLTNYFGTSIHKASFFNGSYKYDKSLKPALLTVGFDAIGTKNKGHIYFQWEKRGADWNVVEMAYTDDEGKIEKLVDSSRLQDISLEEWLFDRNRLEITLNQLIEKGEGAVILVRSGEKNDFIQTHFEILDNGDKAFSVIYSDGFREWNKNLYRTKYCPEKEEVIKLFILYSRGSDAHTNLVEWDKLTVFEHLDDDIIHLRFGES